MIQTLVRWKLPWSIKGDRHPLRSSFLVHASRVVLVACIRKELDIENIFKYILWRLQQTPPCRAWIGLFYAKYPWVFGIRKDRAAVSGCNRTQGFLRLEEARWKIHRKSGLDWEVPGWRHLNEILRGWLKRANTHGRWTGWSMNGCRLAGNVVSHTFVS